MGKVMTVLLHGRKTGREPSAVTRQHSHRAGQPHEGDTGPPKRIPVTSLAYSQ